MRLFDLKPLVIVALHLPNEDANGAPRTMDWLEDYVYQNMSVFQKAGVPAVIVQDQKPPVDGKASPEVIAKLAALTRSAAREFPQTQFGVIVRAHDPYAAIASAYGAGATFVRIKVFVGTMVKAEGVLQGCGVEAVAFRSEIGAQDIAILADVHDRTGQPLVPVPIAQAAGWAAHSGANGLVLTGSNFAESIDFLKTVRGAGIQLPRVMGGSATAENVGEVLANAEGVIVSTSLFRDGAPNHDPVQWDYDKTARFMERARQGSR